MKGLAWWKKAILALLVLAGFALLAFPAPEPGFHGFHPRIQGLYIVSFLLVVLPLLWIGIPRLKQFLEARYEAIKGEIEEAQRQFAEAEQRLRDAQTRLENLQNEIEALMAEFRALGEKERDALVHEGAVLSERIRAETDFAMSQAAKVAKQEIRNTLVEATLELVKERVRSTAQGRVSDKLVDKFSSEVGRVNPRQ